MTAFDQIFDAVTDAGYTMRHDTVDDVHRIYAPAKPTGETLGWLPDGFSEMPEMLVGMVIVRQGVVRYAEMLGKIYPWWTKEPEAAERVGSATYEMTDQLIRWIWGNPA